MSIFDMGRSLAALPQPQIIQGFSDPELNELLMQNLIQAQRDANLSVMQNGEGSTADGPVRLGIPGIVLFRHRINGGDVAVGSSPIFGFAKPRNRKDFSPFTLDAKGKVRFITARVLPRAFAP